MRERIGTPLTIGEYSKSNVAVAKEASHMEVSANTHMTGTLPSIPNIIAATMTRICNVVDDIIEKSI